MEEEITRIKNLKQKYPSLVEEGKVVKTKQQMDEQKTSAKLSSPTTVKPDEIHKLDSKDKLVNPFIK